MFVRFNLIVVEKIKFVENVSGIFNEKRRAGLYTFSDPSIISFKILNLYLIFCSKFLPSEYVCISLLLTNRKFSDRLEKHLFVSTKPWQQVQLRPIVFESRLC